jgi:phosphatidylserine decarboxylase
MSAWQRSLITGLKVLPQHTLSAWMGHAAGVQLPAPLAKLAITAFGKTVGVDFDEIRDPLSSFSSLQSFFTRALKDGVRPIDNTADGVASPCDGTWGACGTLDGDTAFQLKGRSYDIRQLLDGDERCAMFRGGSYATLYLSPRDYHRFHVPVDGVVDGLRYVPGALWPVNGAGLQHVDGLFTKNERVIAWLRPKHDPNQCIAMVAVAATMVGKIRVVFDDVTTNEGGHQSVVQSYDPAPLLDKGAEWGRFEFGSTIVMIATPGCWNLEPAEAGTPLRMGTRIGKVGS